MSVYYQERIINAFDKRFEGIIGCDECGDNLLIVDVAKDKALSDKTHEVYDAYCPSCLTWLGTLRIEQGR